MAFTPKRWEDEPDPLGVLQGTVQPTSGTPIDAAALIDLEQRLAANDSHLLAYRAPDGASTSTPPTSFGDDGDMCIVLPSWTGSRWRIGYQLIGPKTDGAWPSTVVASLAPPAVVSSSTLHGTGGVNVLGLSNLEGDVILAWGQLSILNTTGLLTGDRLHGSLKPSGTARDGTEALRRLGSGAGEAAPGAGSLGTVEFVTGSEPRPTGHDRYLWIGPDGITPGEMAVGDLLARAAA